MVRVLATSSEDDGNSNRCPDAQMLPQDRGLTSRESSTKLQLLALSVKPQSSWFHRVSTFSGIQRKVGISYLLFGLPKFSRHQPKQKLLSRQP
jgi:hypothetical protein